MDVLKSNLDNGLNENMLPGFARYYMVGEQEVADQ
jgi:hypothetical protein